MELRAARRRRTHWTGGFASGCVILCFTLGLTLARAEPYGLEQRPQVGPFLNGRLPTGAGQSFPVLLSQSGVFGDLTSLIPSPGFIPFDVNSPLWSDGAHKTRWIAVPTEKQIQFSPNEPWVFPAGTVFLKHFELGLNDTNPAVRRRIETRLLLVATNGGVFGATYRWRADQTEADLLTAAATETVLIQGTNSIRKQRWSYPGSADCLLCHTPRAGQALGAKTAQLQRLFTYPSTGITASQLRTWRHLGLFANPPDEAALDEFPRMTAIDEASATPEDRIRSYLDANCSSCHQPEGSAHATFDARFHVPLWSQGLINGHVAQDLELSGARVIAPGDPDRSMIPARLSRLDEHKMPPVGRNVVDAAAVGAFRDWIASLPRQDGPYRLISTGAEWRFRDNGSEPAPGWQGLNYDDQGWQVGPAELGFGDGDEITLLKAGVSNTVYFRREFTLERAALYTNLAVRLLRDDGARLFLNGAEVLRSNLPDGEITASTFALTDIDGEAETIFIVAAIPAARLLEGRNVLAAEVHQSRATGGDLSFDLELLGWTLSPASLLPPRLELTRSAAAGSLNLRLNGFDGQAYLVESSTDFLHWSSRWTNITSGGVRDTFERAGSAPVQFYRARVWP